MAIRIVTVSVSLYNKVVCDCYLSGNKEQCSSGSYST